MAMPTVVRRHRFASGALCGLVAGMLVAGGVAAAKIPASSTGVISACRNAKTGVVRVIDAQAGKRCRPGEKAFSWNAIGRTGARGPVGPPATIIRRKATLTSTYAPPNDPTPAALSTFLPAGDYMVTARTILTTTAQTGGNGQFPGVICKTTDIDGATVFTSGSQLGAMTGLVFDTRSNGKRRAYLTCTVGTYKVTTATASVDVVLYFAPIDSSG